MSGALCPECGRIVCDCAPDEDDDHDDDPLGSGPVYPKAPEEAQDRP